MFINGKEIKIDYPVCPKCHSHNIDVKFNYDGHTVFRCECGEEILYSFSNIENILEYLPIELKNKYNLKKEKISEYEKLISEKDAIQRELDNMETKINEYFSKLVVGKYFFGNNRYIKVLRISSSNKHRLNIYNMNYGTSLWCLIVYVGQKPQDNNIIHYGYYESIYLSRYCKEVSNTEFENALKNTFEKILEISKK